MTLFKISTLAVCLLTLATVDFLSVVDRHAFAGEPGEKVVQNGLRYNGLKVNGLRVNGLRYNGLRFNGLRFNGLSYYLSKHEQVDQSDNKALVDLSGQGLADN